MLKYKNKSDEKHQYNFSLLFQKDVVYLHLWILNFESLSGNLFYTSFRTNH